MPAAVHGILQLGDEAIPVIRLDRLFGWEPAPLALYSPLLILRTAEGRFAVPADAIDGITPLDRASVRPLPPGGTFNGCAVAEIQAGEQTIHLLSAERILLLEEQRRLAEFAAMAGQRWALFDPCR